MELVFLRARWFAPADGIFLGKDPLEGDIRRSQSMNGWGYAEGNPINSVDPAGLERFAIFASAFIPYEELEFPHFYEGLPMRIPLIRGPIVNIPFVDPDAQWHGDSRGFYPDGDSARVSHRIVIDTDPNAASLQIENKPFAGETKVKFEYLGLLSTEEIGQAPFPPPAKIARNPTNRCVTKVDIVASVGNPLSPPGTPPIEYEYHLVFDTERGVLTVSGKHSRYPAHELFIEGLGTPVVEQFTPYTDQPTNTKISRPSPGSGPTHTPADLFRGMTVEVPRSELGIPKEIPAWLKALGS
jgi:hypothetical protein